MREFMEGDGDFYDKMQFTQKGLHSFSVFCVYIQTLIKILEMPISWPEIKWQIYFTR